MASRNRFKDIVGKAQKNKNYNSPSVDDDKVTHASGTPTTGSTTNDRKAYQDTIVMKSDDSGDEWSPLVNKSSPSSADDLPSKRKSGTGNEKTTKNLHGQNPRDRRLTSSSETPAQSAAATLPIQTRVDWVRLASFDHFEDENSKTVENDHLDLNPSQSESSFPPDASESQALLNNDKSKSRVAGADADNYLVSRARTGTPPPSYSAHDNDDTGDATATENKNKKNKIDDGYDKNTNDDDVFAEPPKYPNEKIKFALLDPSSPQRCKPSTTEKSSHLRLLAAARTVQASVRMSRLERVRRRAKWAGKKFIVFLVSHIGVTLVVLLYATAGGFLFRWLEMDDEIARRKDMMDLRYRYLDEMWNETNKFNVLHRQNWTLALRGILMDFERRVYKRISEGTWDGAGEDVITKWTIPGSLLFSTTVVTSIGYGDITPRTVAGKLVCIPFAIIGIPLTLLCLANLGQLLAVAFKFFWRRMTQCANFFCNCNARGRTNSTDDQQETRIPILVCVAIIVGYTLGGAAIFSSWEAGWTFLDGFYFSFITLSTIGFGDFVPGQYESGTNERRVVCTLYLMTGLALLSMVFQLIIDSVRFITRRYAQIFGLTEEQIARDVKGMDNAIQVQEIVAPSSSSSPASHLPLQPVIVVTSSEGDTDVDHDPGKESVICGNHLDFDASSERFEKDVEVGDLGNDDDNAAIVVAFDDEVVVKDETQSRLEPLNDGDDTRGEFSSNPAIAVSIDDDPGHELLSNDDNLTADNKMEILPDEDGGIKYSDFISTPTMPGIEPSGGIVTTTPVIGHKAEVLYSPLENNDKIATSFKDGDSDITNEISAQPIPAVVRTDDYSPR